ncbi:hypothetical protein CYMTET_25320, partial [Cymbomonas tetramitiformis]
EGGAWGVSSQSQEGSTKSDAGEGTMGLARGKIESTDPTVFLDAVDAVDSDDIQGSPKAHVRSASLTSREPPREAEDTEDEEFYALPSAAR